VLPAANSDLLALFQQKQIDAAWTVEPWVTRLESEAGGKVFLEENDAITTILVARAGFAAQHKEIVAQFAAAHADLTAWMGSNPAEAKRLVTLELEVETSRGMAAEILDPAWNRLEFTTSIEKAALEKFVDAAQSVGFLDEKIDLTRLLEPIR
jgi:NitT/TauT family transport system substrate-binding protein